MQNRIELKMDIINRSWKERYQKIGDFPTDTNLPLSEKITIEQFKARDLLLNQEVNVKIINLNEDQEIRDLAQYLWHYEISLNRKATNKSPGKTLLKLVDAQRDDVEGLFILVTESGGRSLRYLFETEEKSEDIDSFKTFLSSDKKIKWQAILRLIEGLYSLHSSGLLHRNLSLDSIYFDAEAYREGEQDILKIGDFNWSIYLHSISNILSNQITSEVIKDNIHFFRAPECIPTDLEEKLFGENYASDLFSFGLVISFLFIEIDVERFINSEGENRNVLLETFHEELSKYRGFPEETEIFTRLTKKDPDERYSNTIELLEDTRDLVDKIKFNFTSKPSLPVFYERDRTKTFVKRASDDIKLSIDLLLRQPNDFLESELKNKKLCLTNNIEYPLWTRGNSGSYYRFRRLPQRSKLARIEIFYPRQERELYLSDNEVAIVGTFMWADKNETLPYMNWEDVFSNAITQVKDIKEDLSMEELKKRHWLESLDLIEKAEEDVEKMNIFEYEILDSEEAEINNLERTKQISILIYNDEEKDDFTELLAEADSTYVELLDTNNLFEYFRTKRKWKVIQIMDETEQTTTLKLEGNIRNEDVNATGYLRLWELRNTVFLLQRKRQIIKSLQSDDHILNAILFPARYHKFFKKYDKNELVSSIYYTDPIFLLQGPPGTGKTYNAIDLIKFVLERDPYSRILITSKEHSALDDLLEKCVLMLEKTKLSPKPYLIRLLSTEKETQYSPSSIPYKNFITQVVKRFLEKLGCCNESECLGLFEDLEKVLQKELNSPSKEWAECLRESSNLVFCTSTGSDLKRLESFTQNFDLVIVEEAGKTYPSELFKPMQLGYKWVLIGDQNQLPPFRIEDVYKILTDKFAKMEEERLHEPDFDLKDFLKFKEETFKEVKVFQSMFEKFKGIKHSFDENDETKACDTLLDQYRLPSKISRMISTIFYKTRFRQMIEDPKDLIIQPQKFRNEQLIWINTPKSTEFREKRKGVNLYNMGEARLISRLLKKIQINENHKNFKFVILTPYKEQVSVLKKILPDKLPNLRNGNPRLHCHTIDSFQGQEADLVIISLVRNNNLESAKRSWGFVPKLERLNVMLSRAMGSEIIIGNYDACIVYRGNRYMKKFIKVANFFKKEGLVIDYNEV